MIDGHPLTASYQGGDGNDFVLSYEPDPILNMDDLQHQTNNAHIDHHIIIRRDGDNLQVLIDLMEVMNTPSANLNSLTINGQEGRDFLLVDYSGGLIDLPVSFDGGVQSVQSVADGLTLVGGPMTEVTHRLSNLYDGLITVVSDTARMTITYTDLEPIMDVLTAVERRFEYLEASEAITLSAARGREIIVLQDFDEDDLSWINSTGGQEIVFLNPSGSLNIDSSQGSGSDYMAIEGLGANFNADLTIISDDNDDIIFQAQSINIGSNNLWVAGRSITVSAGIALSTNTTGTITFTATRHIALQAKSLITTADGSITLLANQGPTPITGNFVGIHLSETVIAAHNGPIHLQGRGGDFSDFLMEGGTLGASAGNTITLNVDIIALRNDAVVQGQDLLIQPRYPTTTIGLGHMVGLLNLTDAELDNLQDGFRNIIIGDLSNGQGDVNIETATFKDAVSIGGGSILVNGLEAGTNPVALIARTGPIFENTSDMDIVGQSILLAGEVSPSDVDTPGRMVISGNIAFSGNHTYTVQLNGNMAETGYDQLQVTGSRRTINLDNIVLDLSLGYTPADGDKLVIIDVVDRASLIVGQFNSLAESDIITLNHVDFRLTYAGGTDMNDVVLTAQRPDLVINKRVSLTAAQPGDTITYTIAFTNAGHGVAQGVVITDVLSAETPFADALSVVNIIISGVMITNLIQSPLLYSWQIQNLSANDRGLITLTAQITFDLTAGIRLTNTAFTSTTKVETDRSNNKRMAGLSIVNVAPVAIDDHHTLTEDSVLSVEESGVLSNDSDGNGDVLSATLIVTPRHGLVFLNVTGGFMYTPTADFVGTDRFTYTVSDGHGGTDIGRVIITVTMVNDVPVANDDRYSIKQNTTLTVAATGVLSNDIDIENESLTSTLVTDVSTGRLILNRDGSFAYTPTAGYTGPITFTYFAHDGQAASNIATGTITIEDNEFGPIFEDDVTDSLIQERYLTTYMNSDYNYLIRVTSIDARLTDAGRQRTALDIYEAQITTATKVYSLYALALPSWLNFVDHHNNTGTLHGTPTRPGVNFVTIVASDGIVSTTQAFSVTVLPHIVHLPLVFKSSPKPTPTSTPIPTPTSTTVPKSTPTRPTLGGHPDLVIESLRATENSITLVIKNQGLGAVVDAFWVEAYINPKRIPQGVNDGWKAMNSEGGVVWGIRGDFIPIQPGQRITLTLDHPAFSPDPDSSPLPLEIRVGSVIYAQVDSANINNGLGGVFEADETNNMGGPIFAQVGQTKFILPNQTNLIPQKDLPPRFP